MSKEKDIIITDGMVHRAAKVFYEAQGGADYANSYYRDSWDGMARRALETAFEVTDDERNQTMTERIDYADQAVALLRRVSGSRMSDAEASVSVSAAQVHATLALVEAQKNMTETLAACAFLSDLSG